LQVILLPEKRRSRGARRQANRSGVEQAGQQIEKAGEKIQGAAKDTDKNSLREARRYNLPMAALSAEPLLACAAKSFAVARRSGFWPAWSWSSIGAKRNSMLRCSFGWSGVGFVPASSLHPTPTAPAEL